MTVHTQIARVGVAVMTAVAVVTVASGAGHAGWIPSAAAQSLGPTTPTTPGLVVASSVATASVPVTPATTTTRTVRPEIPTTTRPLVDRRASLTRELTLGQGQLRFAPPGTERARSGAKSALAIATKSLRTKPRGDRPEVFFALFSAPSPSQRNPDGSRTPLYDRRPVWVVRFPRVIGERQSGVVRRKNVSVPTSLQVITDIVVIVDDRTGTVVLTSEYLAEA